MKKLLRFGLFFLFSLAILVAFWFNYIRYGGNFHKVSNEVYRSAQPYSFNLPKWQEKYHFKTILNLRGEKPNKEWYEYEKRFAKEHNITLINFKISDKKVQSIKTMQKIIDIIKTSKKPILIHCRAGADRTGLASALYLYSINDPRYKEMLSIKYGHFPYLGSKTKAMDKSLEKFIQSSQER
jgi:protein tyrosine/serine phosphatase